jgi:hypothetical protein
MKLSYRNINESSMKMSKIIISYRENNTIMNVNLNLSSNININQLMYVMSINTYNV